MCTEYMWDVIDTHHISILMLGNLLFASCMQAQIDADNNFLWKSMPQPHHAALTKAHFVYLVMCCSDLQQTDNCKSNHIHQPINKQDPSHSQHLYVWSDFLKIQVVTRNFENYWWQLTTIEYITHQFWSPKSTSVFILFAGVFAAFLPPLPWDVRPPATWRTKVRAHSMAPR